MKNGEDTGEGEIRGESRTGLRVRGGEKRKRRAIK